MSKVDREFHNSIMGKLMLAECKTGFRKNLNIGEEYYVDIDKEEYDGDLYCVVYTKVGRKWICRCKVEHFINFR